MLDLARLTSDGADLLGMKEGTTLMLRNMEEYGKFSSITQDSPNPPLATSVMVVNFYYYEESSSKSTRRERERMSKRGMYSNL